VRLRERRERDGLSWVIDEESSVHWCLIDPSSTIYILPASTGVLPTQRLGFTMMVTHAYVQLSVEGVTQLRNKMVHFRLVLVKLDVTL